MHGEKELTGMIAVGSNSDEVGQVAGTVFSGRSSPCRCSRLERMGRLYDFGSGEPLSRITRTYKLSRKPGSGRPVPGNTVGDAETRVPLRDALSRARDHRRSRGIWT
jgi:hypothetical protein